MQTISVQHINIHLHCIYHAECKRIDLVCRQQEPLEMLNRRQTSSRWKMSKPPNPL